MADENTPVWKKEIHLFGGRKKAPKVAQPEPVEAVAERVPEPKAEKTSVWKKEISFRRKPKAPKPPKAEKPKKVKPPKAEKPKKVKPPKAEKPKKVKPPKAEKPPKAPKQPKLKAPKPPKPEKARVSRTRSVAKAQGDVPFWKKEISFRRKPKTTAAEPVVEERIVLEHPILLEPAAQQPAPAPTPEPAPTAAAKLEPVADESPQVVEFPHGRDEPEVFDLDHDHDDEETVELPPPAAAASAEAPEPEPESERVETTAAPTPSLFGQVTPPATPVQAAVPAAGEQRGPFTAPAAPESVSATNPDAEPTVAVAAAAPEASPESGGKSRFRLIRRGPKPKKEKGEKLSRAERKARRVAVKEARKKLPGGAKKHKVKKIVGLKVGASQIAAARVSNNGSVELLHAAREPLESGIVVAGELRDPEALASALKSFFKKHKLPKRGIRLGLSNNRIGVRLFEIAGMHDPEQLRNAIRFRAQETLPIPLEEAVLDYHVVGESVDEEGNKSQKVLLVVAYRDLIDRYVAACRKAGLRLIGIDLEAFALLRALGKSPDEMDLEERVGLVVVSIGHERSTFAVSDGVVCEFTRVLDWGGFSLNVAVARALDLTPPEAEPIKLSLSLADPSVVPHGLSSEHAKAARDAVARSVEGFARDLVSSLRFYQSQPDSLGIREIVLTGGTAEMPGLAAELERLIGVYVRLGDPFGRVKVSRKVKQRDRAGSLAAAIGLGIED